MENARVTGRIDRRHQHDDVRELFDYIDELELRLAGRDALLATKEDRIDALESEVHLMQKRTSVFRARAAEEVAAPWPSAGARQPPAAAAATPAPVSDDSGEGELESRGSLSLSLSHITQVPSSDEESTPRDGRWNIPFDSSFDELVAKLPSKAGQPAAVQSVFVPIREAGRRRCPEVTTTPLKPVPRSGRATTPALRALARDLANEARKDKENVSPKARRSPVDIGAYRGIR